jgi:DNA-binding response OmpR family regulator
VTTAPTTLTVMTKIESMVPRPEGLSAAVPTLERPAGHPRIAIIDRDSSFVQVLLNRLDRLGWQAVVCADPPPLADLLEMRLSGLVMDPAVIGPDPFAFIEVIGREIPELGLIVCSRATSVSDRVRALHLGADDWLNKPCHPDEVAARMEAILRRGRRATSRLMTESSVAGEVEIDLSRFQVTARGESLDLTRREFEVIRMLAAAPGKVLTREEIYEQVWGYRMAHGDRSVDVFVRKVRQKLETASPEWIYIHTHFGLGYRFEPQAKPPA